MIRGVFSGGARRRPAAAATRGGRTAAPAAASGTRRDRPQVLVVTTARDEGDMLRRWVAHYGAQVGTDHLIVIDDGSTDGSTDGLPCTVHRVPTLPGGTEFEPTRMRVVNGVARGMLAVYDVVIFTDVDEFLVPDPAQYGGLVDFLAARPEQEIIAPVALNVLHCAAVEKDLVADAPVLGQRRYAKFVPALCKPSIKRVPAPWLAASHGIGAPFAVDPELFLVHLKWADRELLRAVGDKRHELYAADGRALRSSWNRRGDELAALLDEFVGSVDPASVPEFDPHGVDLSGVVVRPGKDRYRTGPVGQIEWMRRQPLVRVPERLLGMV